MTQKSSLSHASALITGFGPYPGVEWNPSGALLPLLGEAGRLDGGSGSIAVAELPVAYDTVDAALAEAIELHSPSAVMMLGLRPSGTAVDVERVALNLDDAAKPDNQSVLRRGEAIAPDGPPAFISTAPLDQLCQHFTDVGVPAGISNHAGAYICNRTYYLAQLRAAQGSPERACVFIHLPWIGRPGIARLDGEPLQLEDLVAPLLRCAQRLAAPAATLSAGAPPAPASVGT